MLFSGAWGKMIHEKNLMQEISWHCPFKVGIQEIQGPNIPRNFLNTYYENGFLENQLPVTVGWKKMRNDFASTV